MTVSSLNEPGEPNSPMRVSDIIKTGWQLYRAHFSQYFVIAIIATAWSLLPTLFNLLTTLVPSYLGTELSPGISILIFVVWLAIALYAIAQSLGQFASISRLAYQTLDSRSGASESNLSGSDLAKSAVQFTRSRKFSFLGATILQSLILFFTGLGMGIK